jgi:hypothetical protein
MELEQPSAVVDSFSVNTDTGATNTEPPNLEGLLEQQQAEPEEIEEELEGLKLRGKKDAVEEFKKGRMLHADYTRKTQELADEKRNFGSERESFTRQRQADAQLEAERFQAWSAHQRVQQLQQVNFTALRQANPEFADQLRDELAQLSAALPGMSNALSQKLQQRNLEAQQLDARRANDSEAVVMREVKDWGPEKLAKFNDAGQKAGIPPEGMRQLLIHFPQAASPRRWRQRVERTSLE